MRGTLLSIALALASAASGCGSSGSGFLDQFDRDTSSEDGAPVAQPDMYGTSEDTLLFVAAAAGVLANDYDDDSTALEAFLVTLATSGAVSLSVDGGFSYSPGAGFTGTDSFSYAASDGSLTSEPAVVSIAID